MYTIPRIRRNGPSLITISSFVNHRVCNMLFSNWFTVIITSHAKFDINFDITILYVYQS